MRLFDIVILFLISSLSPSFKESSNVHGHARYHSTQLPVDTSFLPISNFQFPAGATRSGDPIKTVSTFQSISLYWKPAEGASSREALVRYRIKGQTKWTQAQSLWFDERVADSIGNNNARSK